MTIDPRGPRLGETCSRIRVSAEAARAYCDYLDPERETTHDLGQLAAELAERLAAASRRRGDEGRDRGEAWRLRSRTLGLDMMARVHRRGDVAEVVSLTVRHYRQAAGPRRGYSCEVCEARFATRGELGQHIAVTCHVRRPAANASPPEPAAYDPDVARRHRPHQLPIRLSEEEYAAIRSAAEREGEPSASQWARAVLLERAGAELAEPLSSVVARMQRAGASREERDGMVMLLHLFATLPAGDS